jgi:hypothetical protein
VTSCLKGFIETNLMVQSKFNLVNWFVSYNIFCNLKRWGLPKILSPLTHAHATLASGLPTAKYEGRAPVADDDSVPAAAGIYYM